MGSKVTIRDLAKACDVSTALVSKALKGKPGVEASRRDFIIKTAKELGYDFDMLRGRDIQRISAYLLEDHDLAFALPFFGSVLAGIDEECKNHSIAFSFSTLSQKADINKAIFESNSQAAVFLGFFPAAMREQISSSSYPCAMVDGYAPNVICFNVNNFALSYEITCHLIKQGAKRLAFLVPLRDHYSVGERERGFLQALYDHDLPLDPNYQLSSSALGRKSHEIDQDVEYLFSLKNKPDAIVTYNDQLALQVMKSCSRLGIRIPDDVLLTGFDGTDICQYLSPSLTSANIDGKLMGQSAAKALIDKLTPSNYELKGTIMLRQSSSRTKLN